MNAYFLTEEQFKRMFFTPWWAYLPAALIPIVVAGIALFLR